MNRQLPFVGWVEWNFSNFWTCLTDRSNNIFWIRSSQHHFAALQESRFRCITSCFTLQNWTSFTSKEYSSITEWSNASKWMPCWVILKLLVILTKNIIRLTSVVDFSTWLIFSGIGFFYLIIEPHMSYSHSVLCQSTSFIWANCWSRTQSLDSFQILDQTVLLCHSFGSQGQTDCNGSKETFWNISDNDTWIWFVRKLRK